ncbi:MAG TPA: PD-(D/E)XK nuclease family protein [Vicinamibacterales bacterium]|nr:PD-(D/E)XK nuclease family protein [Vicinamibacterales bacterium]
MARMKARPTGSPHIRVLESSATHMRLAEARAFVRDRAARGDVLIVSASRGAADDLARSIAVESGATIGLHRFSLTQLAARLAAPSLAGEGRAVATGLGAEAVAARATFDAQQEHALTYFDPVAMMPGFARALARTLQELRLAGVEPSALASMPLGGADLSVLLEKFEEQFASASTSDRAVLFDTAAVQVAAGQAGINLAAPLVLLDVPLDPRVEFDFVRALMAASSDVLVTVPFGDIRALDRLEAEGLTPEVVTQTGETDLVALRRYMFASSTLAPREPRGDVRFFSAPGEGRECVEIARRILDEARAGVPFDEIAVFVRSPERYAGLLEQAFRRVPSPHEPQEPGPHGPEGIPAWFDRGTRRPHPAGRAFLAILACACEKLSARRFAEYLSLAQVPQSTAVRDALPFVVPDDEVFSFREDDERVRSAEPGEPGPESPAPDLDAAVVDGSLRAPWKWETLIVESAVIGGDPTRWHRRLNGLEREYRLKIQRETKEDPGSPRAERLERDRTNLSHLRSFVLPVIDEIAAWPRQSTWGEWLDLFETLAPRILRQPERVVAVLAELRPMSGIGPVTLDEARAVMSERLLLLEQGSSKLRYGRVFIGSPQQARGRTFRVVFVPGLAERMFPLKPHEDPMMLDHEVRIPLKADLPLQKERGQAERLLLRLAVGSATERLWLSYPRIEMAESRSRVPSFYALDVMRAITGRIPDHESLQDRAAREGGAGLAWPSPDNAAAAIDDLEHDLAVLKELLNEDSVKVRGHAHYLLRLNESLKRSVTARWGRARSQWTPFDGITRVTSLTGPMLESQRMSARPYSLSALQKFSSCPYQFLLSAIYRLDPAEEPKPLQKLDPLTRGALFHEVQAQFFRALEQAGRLPVVVTHLPEVLLTLDRIVREVAAAYHEQLAPAIERVWRDEIADIAKDLRVWVRRLPDAGQWLPTYFEYSFGLPLDLEDQQRDPRSRSEPVLVDGRFMLRGSIDLVEQKQGTTIYRVTDHKTGKNRTTWKTVLGGGAVLQPVLYSLAVEQALEAQVSSGRLFYCTAAGGFTDHEIPINDANRRAGLEALEIVDRAIELGFLPAAPASRACGWCDFRPVCGPHEEQRVRVKPAEKLGDLDALRRMP